MGLVADEKLLGVKMSKALHDFVSETARAQHISTSELVRTILEHLREHPDAFHAYSIPDVLSDLAVKEFERMAEDLRTKGVARFKRALRKQSRAKKELAKTG